MANIKRANASSITKAGVAISDVPDAPTIGAVTDLADGSSVTVAYTAAVTGGTATTFTATSTPGSITGTGSSPITVTGLSAGTSYTFKVKGSNSTATGPESSASASVTPTLPPLSAYDSIATVTVGSGGQSSIVFSSIPQTYTHLQIRLFGQTNRSDVSRDNYRITFNGDTGTNYSYHGLYGTGSATGSYGGTSASFVQSNTLGSLGYFGVSIVDIFDYTNTSINKTLRCLGGVNDNSAGWTVVDFDSGNWRSTAAITSITLNTGNGGGSTAFVQYTQAGLFGIKGA